MDKLSKGDKAILKYLAVWLCLETFRIIEIIGFVGIIGTAGALEQDVITFGHAIIQSAIIIASMVFVAFLIYIMEEIALYVRRKAIKIIREERTEAKHCVEEYIGQRA